MVILCISLDIPPILVNTMSKTGEELMKEIEAIEAQYDMTTREGIHASYKAISHHHDLQRIDKHQIVFEREHNISKEDWENTTFSVKMAMIYMHQETYSVAEIEESIQDWLNQCPI